MTAITDPLPDAPSSNTGEPLPEGDAAIHRGKAGGGVDDGVAVGVLHPGVFAPWDHEGEHIGEHIGEHHQGEDHRDGREKGFCADVQPFLLRCHAQASRRMYL